MHLKKLLLAASFISTMAVTATLATAAQADTFTVYTGYADSLRASGFFPTVWLGDSNVVSESAAVQGGGFDSGAIRIQNTGATAITVSNFSVTMNGGSGGTYNFWNSLTINAGMNGIFTQTGAYNFDSSDNSPNGGPYGGLSGSSAGSNGIGGCSSTHAAQVGAGIDAQCAVEQPIVAFDIGSDHFSFNDTGHIIDTGWYDFINGSTDGNESINWNVVGSGANRSGNSGAPEPASWALMLLGFGGLGAVLRRRRIAIAA